MAPAWFMTIGYIGPRKNPTNDTEIAPESRSGTSQTTSSRLRNVVGSQFDREPRRGEEHTRGKGRCTGR